jgi:hypothetical protein
VAKLDAMRVVEQAIHDRVGDGGIGQSFVPLLDGKLAGDSVESFCQEVRRRSGWGVRGRFEQPVKLWIEGQ